MAEGEVEGKAAKALEGVKVLELCRLVAGPYCAKLMADLGAEVLKIEEPGRGDDARWREPFPGDAPHPERSGLFLYLNTNKLGLTLNLRAATGKEIFRALVREADILVEDHPPGTLASLGLGYEALRAINPKLVMTSITPFGQTGPYRDYRAYSMSISHGGGEGYILPPGPQYLDRPPVKPGRLVADYDAALHAAVATLGALYWQRLSGLGQHIDVSKQEAALSLSRVVVGKYTDDGSIESRGTRRRRVGNLIRCKDGYVEIMPLNDRLWQRVREMMGHPSWAQEERYQTAAGRSSRIDELNELMEGWAKERTKEQIYRRAVECHAPVGIYSTAEDLLNSEQLQVRGFFVDIEHPKAGKIRYPAAPYKFSQTPWGVERPAPLLGQHNEEIYSGHLGYSPEDLAKMRAAGII